MIRLRRGGACPRPSLVALIIVSVGAGLQAGPPSGDPLTQARETMVREQIVARGVSDARVLAAMRRVPRHEFVPEGLRAYAYDDTPLPIGEGQTISQPYIVALMTELAQLKPGDRVLEVGTGSGYQAAVLAELTTSVYTVEIRPSLAARAKTVLERLGYHTVKTRTGDGYHGWPEAAPFDAILVTAAPNQLPEPLVSQLAEGGRLVAPIGPPGNQELMGYAKRKGRLLTERVLPVSFVPLIRSSTTPTPGESPRQTPLKQSEPSGGQRQVPAR